MDLTLFAGAALSALLIGGGAALALGAGRMEKDARAARLKLIPAAVSPLVPARTDGAELMREPPSSMAAAELRALTRACRRLRIPARHASKTLLGLRLGLAAVMGALGLLSLRLGLSDLPAVVQLTVAAGPAMAAWLAPGIMLQKAARRHALAVAAGLPEALELLLVCVEAGLSLQDGVDRVSKALEWSQPELAAELVQTAADLKILPDRDQALAALADRIDLPGVRSVVTSLSQTLRYGTPLSQALRRTASELRNDGLLALEERANRLPTLLTVPMMLFMMPTIFLILGGPAALRLLDTFGG